MSDVEEPPTKMSKYTELQYLDEECEEALDDGQEEWLSEGVLTDDDYNTTADTQNETNLNSSQNESILNTTQNETNLDSTQNETNRDSTQNEANLDSTPPPEETETHQEPETATTDRKDTAPQPENINNEQNIEETLNNLEGVKEEDRLEDELEPFLISKEKIQAEDSLKPANEKDDNDDGNDTDDLLRMLGEDSSKLKKKTLKLVRYADQDQSSDDNDEYIFERSKIKTLKIAKNALIKRQPAIKAEPEDSSDGDDTDLSSDEGDTMKKMFGVLRKQNIAAKSTAKTTKPQTLVKRAVHFNTGKNKTETTDSKLVKQYTNKKVPLKSAQKSGTTLSKSEIKPSILKSVEIKTPIPFKPLEKNTSNSEKGFKSDFKDFTIKSEDTEDDFLDEEHFNEDYEESSGMHQRIRRPEVMDEEVPSDADTDTHTEDGSLYDELPSSDSDDMDDWFALDIRAECAGDYLPLLGSKAHELLAAERARVRERVSTLRQSLSALTGSARRQADQLRAAAMTLAEVDDTLRAA